MSPFFFVPCPVVRFGFVHLSRIPDDILTKGLPHERMILEEWWYPLFEEQRGACPACFLIASASCYRITGYVEDSFVNTELPP